MTDLTLGENLMIWALSAIVALWVFALGANLGSFLNVVVYRMPRGMPLALSLSRCPKCANPIAARDNIPIISWLRLRGRCRACGQPISARYPLVEAAVGGLFVIVFFWELLSGGWNLPLRPPNRAGFVELFATTRWVLIGIAAVHACLLYLLLGIALMQADRRVVPWKWIAAGMILGLAASPLQLMTVDGELSPIVRSSLASSPWEVYGGAMLASAAGLACGAAWGTLLTTLERPTERRRRSALVRAVPAAMALVGLFLGWQAATSVALVTILIWFLGWGGTLARPKLRHVSLSGYILAATVLHLLTWRWQAAIPLWPSHHTSPIAIVAVCIAAAGLVLLNKGRVRENA